MSMRPHRGYRKNQQKSHHQEKIEFKNTNKALPRRPKEENEDNKNSENDRRTDKNIY